MRGTSMGRAARASAQPGWVMSISVLSQVSFVLSGRCGPDLGEAVYGRMAR